MGMTMNDIKTRCVPSKCLIWFRFNPTETSKNRVNFMLCMVYLYYITYIMRHFFWPLHAPSIMPTVSGGTLHPERTWGLWLSSAVWKASGRHISSHDDVNCCDPLGSLWQFSAMENCPFIDKVVVIIFHGCVEFWGHTVPFDITCAVFASCGCSRWQ